jgi:heptosyltransferase-2
MARSLIIAPAWVGDAVLAQPLFRRLHERDADTVIDAFAPAWTHALFARMPEISATLVNPFAHGELALAARYRLARALAEREYTHAMVLPNSFKSALIPFFARIPRRTGYVGEARRGLLNDARPLDKQALPLMVERFAALADPPGASLKRPLDPPRLIVNVEQRAATLAALGITDTDNIAVLCPGAEYGPAKRWPPAYFADLARKFAEARYKVWLVGSANDRAVASEIVNGSGGECVNLCGRTTLAQAIDVIASATVVVANDSGLMHIAAALDKPTLALFGSSSPGFTPPMSTHARVLRLDLPCSPCFQRVCPLGHFDCMRKLTPDHVWQQIDFARITST